jgi:hypothetical protein
MWDGPGRADVIYVGHKRGWRLVATGALRIRCGCTIASSNGDYR